MIKEEKLFPLSAKKRLSGRKVTVLIPPLNTGPLYIRDTTCLKQGKWQQLYARVNPASVWTVN